MSRVLLASPYFPPCIGGVERYAHRLALGLRDRHGHEVSVLTTDGGVGRLAASGAVASGGQDGAGATERHTRHRPFTTETDGLPVTVLRARFRISATPFDPAWPSHVRRVITRTRPDVIVTHAPVPGLADVCLAVRGAVPVIATYHAGSMRKHAGSVDAAIIGYEGTVLRLLLGRAEAVVTTFPGRAAAGVPSRYVPPGVDTTVFRPSAAALRDPHRILYVGRIERASTWKGIGTLLHAFRMILDRFPDARLELVGGGDAVDDWRARAAELGVAHRVEWSGPLGSAALVDAYRRAAVVVLPSETDAEAFGMVLIEAMACGTPVVASRVGGMPVVVADTGGGLLAEPGDAASLAHTLGPLLADDARRARLGAAGLARVTERYRWDAVADAFHELIEDLVAAPPGRHPRRSDHHDRRAG